MRGLKSIVLLTTTVMFATSSYAQSISPSALLQNEEQIEEGITMKGWDVTEENRKQYVDLLILKRSSVSTRVTTRN
jgi:hypothetical protein